MQTDRGDLHADLVECLRALDAAPDGASESQIESFFTLAGNWVMTHRDKLLGVVEDVRRLRSFAQEVMEDWHEGDLYGADRQDIAERYGLLRAVERFQPCGDHCGCAEFFTDEDWKQGQTCYRQTSLLTGDPETDAAIDAARHGRGE